MYLPRLEKVSYASSLNASVLFFAVLMVKVPLSFFLRKHIPGRADRITLLANGFLYFSTVLTLMMLIVSLTVSFVLPNWIIGLDLVLFTIGVVYTMIMATGKEVNHSPPESGVEQSVRPQNCVIVAGTPYAGNLMDVMNKSPESGFLLSAALDLSNGENLTESEIARRWPWLKKPGSLLEMLECVEANEIEVGVTVFPLSDQHHLRLFNDSINSLMRLQDSDLQSQDNFSGQCNNPAEGEEAPRQRSAPRLLSVVQNDPVLNRRMGGVQDSSSSAKTSSGNQPEGLRRSGISKPGDDDSVGVLPDRTHAQKGGVLLVEDQDFIAQFEEDLLEGAGYTVFMASDGAEAVEKFRTFKNQISLVLLDLALPVMSGSECLKELLKIDPTVKVLVVTALMPNDETVKKVLPHVLAHVQKPCRGADLIRSVEMALLAEFSHGDQKRSSV